MSANEIAREKYREHLSSKQKRIESLNPVERIKILDRLIKEEKIFTQGHDDYYNKLWNLEDFSDLINI